MHPPPSRAPFFIASIAAALSLPPLFAETLAERHLFPGQNWAMKGEAGEIAVHDREIKRADDSPGAPAKAVDGLPGTAWSAPVAGPCSWSLDLREVRRVGAVAILWEGEAPSRVVLEGSEDGRDFERLAERGEVGAAADEGRVPENAAFVFAFAKRSVRFLRVSIPETFPGFVAAMREFGAFGGLEEVPSAWLARGTVVGDPDAGFRTAHPSGAIRLHEGWRLAGIGSVPTGKRLLQIVPAAWGGAFALLESMKGEAASREVVRLVPEEGGRVECVSFLAGLPSGVSIAWDGEWVYVDAAGSVEAYRKALGVGPADERMRIAPSLPADLCAMPAGTSQAASVARIDGLLLSEDDGPRIWCARSDGEVTTVFLLEHAKEPDGEAPPLDWNDLPAEALFRYLDHERPSVRREAGYEILRRKRRPEREIGAMLDRGPTEREAEALVALASRLPRERARGLLLRLSESARPEVQRLAFRGLGGLAGGGDPQDFLALGTSTDPPVTAEIFDSLRRIEARLPGAAEVALALVAHADPGLAGASRRYLIEKQEFSLVFRAVETLGSGGGAETLVPLMEVLAEAPPGAVAMWLAEQVAETRLPALRRPGLDALCRLYGRTKSDPNAGELSSRLRDVLDSALANHRIDRVALLDSMKRHALPIPPPGVLVTLAREDLALEPFVVSELLKTGIAPPEEAGAWLKEVAGDSDRDEALRRDAGALLTLLSGSPNPVRMLPETEGVRVADLRAAGAAPRSEGFPEGDPIRGASLFRRYSCHSCHGSGRPGADREPERILSILLGDDGSRGGGSAFVLTETPTGARFLVEQGAENGNPDRLRDLAGNSLSLDEEGLVSLRPLGPRLGGCVLAPWTEAAELADLLAFLRKG